MVAAWRLRCLPVLLLLVHCVVASAVEGTNTGASSRGGHDRKNAANKQRRSTTPDPLEPSTSPSVLEGYVDDPMPAPWVPETDERARRGNHVKVTRKTIHGGKTKARKNGTHVTIVMETGFSTTGTLPLATDHVVPSDMVTASAGAADGSKRPRPGRGKSSPITRTAAETTEPGELTTEASTTQRTHRVKTSTMTTTYPTTTTTKTTTTTLATPSTTTKLPGRKHSTTTTSARTVHFGGRTLSTTRYSNRTTSHLSSSSARGEGCSSSCEMHRCETVEAEVCQGRVVKDRCNCCPVCFTESRSTDESREDVTTRKTTHHPSNACDGMQCPKHKVCILNIQGIPMCRCPNIYSCKGIDRSPLCAQNGVTYKNKCFLKVEECTIGRRIRVEHRGSCRSKPTPAKLQTKAMMMWKTLRIDSEHRTQQATHQRKSSKNDPWRHPSATNSDNTFAKKRKRAGNKSQFS